MQRLASFRLVRLTGAAAALAAVGAVALTLAGDGPAARRLLGLALALGGGALMLAAILFVLARRRRAPQENA